MVNDEYANELVSRDALPSCVLIKKIYPDRKKSRGRAWKLKHLDKDNESIGKGDVEKAQRDYEMFLDDLEEDHELRSKINLYRGMFSFFFLLLRL